MNGSHIGVAPFVVLGRPPRATLLTNSQFLPLLRLAYKSIFVDELPALFPLAKTVPLGYLPILTEIRALLAYAAL